MEVKEKCYTCGYIAPQHMAGCPAGNNSITIYLKSWTLTSHELSDWLDSTFEMLDMGDIIYEVEGAE